MTSYALFDHEARRLVLVRGSRPPIYYPALPYQADAPVVDDVDAISALPLGTVFNTSAIEASFRQTRRQRPVTACVKGCNRTLDDRPWLKGPKACKTSSCVRLEEHRGGLLGASLRGFATNVGGFQGSIM